MSTVSGAVYGGPTPKTVDTSGPRIESVGGPVSGDIKPDEPRPAEDPGLP
jgi:hypothetical protein